MLHHLIFTFKEQAPSLYHITDFHFYLFSNVLFLSPHFDYSFPQDVLFPFLYNIMSFYLHFLLFTHFYYTSVCNIFCIFSFFPLTCLHLSRFFCFIMTFPPHLWLLKVLLFSVTYVFVFIYQFSFYILLVLVLIECAPFCSTVVFVGITPILLLFHLNLPASHRVSLSAPHYASIFTRHRRSAFHIS